MIKKDFNNKNIAEDDNLRSEYIRKIFQDISDLPKVPEETSIPKILIQYWHESDNIPIDVQECIDSWKSIEEQGFTRLLFDDKSAREFILKELGNKYVKAFDTCHHPAMRCDYFRLCFIYKVGGFYVDIDEIYQGIDLAQLYKDNNLKIQPLCYEISSDSMINPSVFLKHNDSTKDWIFYVNNNPIIAPPKHPLINIALERATKLLLKADSHNLEIQSTTGPGNLSAALVKHSLVYKNKNIQCDFTIMPDWDKISVIKWFLSYRNDNRNWRIWNAEGKWQHSIL
jgi:mannosyltransferase OCH1-like enzyme